MAELALEHAAGGLDAPRHLRAAARALLYLLIGLGQGLMYLLLIGPGLIAGLILSPVWRGLLDGTTRLAWRFAESERRQANRLLETHLPPLHSDADRRERTRVLAMLLVKLPIALAGLAVAAAPALLTMGLLALGSTGLAGGDDRVVGPWALGPATGIVLCLLALPAAVLS